MKDRQNKVVLVTGASRGLGQALARRFVKAQYLVVISARNAQSLQAVAEELRCDGGRVLPFPCDVTAKEQVEALAEKVGTQAGAVQILINNAGIARAVSFLEMNDSLWEEILTTNLTGVYNCCKVFLPGMIREGWGRIINIGSTTAKVAYPHVSAYTTSKHGLLGLTRSLALETARLGVTVNAICPGYLNTELTRDNARRMAEKTGKRVEDILALFSQSSPQNRLIEPDEVTSLALMLCSDWAAGMTGQAINVDGGAVMV